MLCLRQNQQPLFYAVYLGKSEIIDEYGNLTGQYEVKYAPSQKAFMNISAARGTAETEQFGISTGYSKTLVTDNMKCEMDTDSILWLNGADPEGPHNYVVVAVARSLNSVTYAVREVSVSEQACFKN